MGAAGGPAGAGTGSWIRRLSRSPTRDGTRLFCFPHAGAGISAFRAWSTSLPGDTALFGVQLPGREDRVLEEPHTDMAELLDDLVAEILPCLDRRFIFFGHSMGALICWELARRLWRDHGEAPARLILSGCNAPCIPGPELSAPAARSDAELLDRLRRLNGTPEELLTNHDFMALLLPAFRADSLLLSRYVYKPGPAIPRPINVLGGTADPFVTEDGLRAWSQFTTGVCDLHLFPGGHMFLNDVREDGLRCGPFLIAALAAGGTPARAELLSRRGGEL